MDGGGGHHARHQLWGYPGVHCLVGTLENKLDKLDTCHDSDLPVELPGNYGTIHPRLHVHLYAHNCTLKYIIYHTCQRQGSILHTQETKY